MKRPKRWLEDGGGASLVERSLLQSGRDVSDPPAGEQDRIFAAITVSLGTPVDDPSGEGGAASSAAGPGASLGSAGAGAGTSIPVGSATVSSALSALGMTGIAKWTLIGAIGAGSLVGGQHLISGRDDVPVAAPSMAALPQSHSASTPARPEPLAETTPSAPPVAEFSLRPEATAGGPSGTAAKALPTPTANDRPTELPSSVPGRARAFAEQPAPTTHASPEDRISRLHEESRLLALVRDSLRRGDGAGALAKLDSLYRQYPGGALAQEREALTVQALAAVGRKSEAATRAAAFLQAWPSSPYAETVRPFAY